MMGQSWLLELRFKSQRFCYKEMRMKYWVSVHMVIDVPSHADAVRCKEATKNLLSNPMVTGMLQANGVPVESITVAEPLPAVSQPNK
jgi:hypothetical protein